MSVTDNNVLPAGYRKKADTNGTMDIKRFSDSYSVLAGKMARVRKFVWGLGIGVLYFLLLVLISFGIYHSIQEPFPQLLIVCILCTGGGMIGGMIS